MSLRINDEAPNFTAETSQGPIDFHKFVGDGWAILFSHPKDFTPVCTTELGYMAGLKPEFEKRNCKIVGLSVDPVSSHSKWAADIEETQGHKVTFPMIGDPELKVAKLYDMLPAEAGDTCEGRTAANNATVVGNRIGAGAADNYALFNSTNTITQSGSLIQNSSGSVLLSAPLLFSTDNTRDIGSASDVRPRTVYVGTSAIIPSIYKCSTPFGIKGTLT